MIKFYEVIEPNILRIKNCKIQSIIFEKEQFTIEKINF